MVMSVRQNVLWQRVQVRCTWPWQWRVSSWWQTQYFCMPLPSSTLCSRWASLKRVSVRNRVERSTVGRASSRSLRLNTPSVWWRTWRHIIVRTAVTRIPALDRVSSSGIGLFSLKFKGLGELREVRGELKGQYYQSRYICPLTSITSLNSL